MTLVNPPADGSAERRMRILELGLVLLIFVAPAIFRSTYIAIYGFDSRLFKSVLFLDTGLEEIGGIALLAYVLNRSGRSLRDICPRFRPHDLITAVGLAVLAWVAYYLLAYAASWIAYFATGQGLDWRVHNMAFMSKLSMIGLIWAVVYSLINPFAEELIVRSYLQTEANS